MTAIIHKVRLESDVRLGRRLPPLHIGHLLVELPLAIRESISMAFRNRSSGRGRPPK